MSHPQKSETVHIERLGDELCIYDWQRKQVHALNPTAARVWQQCDGQTSPAQIAAALQAELSTPHAEELVWLTLDRLAKAHLLQGNLAKPAAFKGLTRRQFIKTMGVAAALLPVVHSIVAPGPVAAQSPVPTATPTVSLGATATTGHTVSSDERSVWN
ncbi:MAG: PqqD family protein [Roseiflexaceae bacterium]